MTSTPQRLHSRSENPSPSRRLGQRPTLRPRKSSSSLQGRNTAPRTVSQSTLTALPPRLYVSTATPTTNSSPASSVINVELTEGILLRDADEGQSDLIENEDMIEGEFSAPKEDEEGRKKSLRDHLRRTLSQRDIDTSLQPARRKGKVFDINEISLSPEDSYPQRQYFVFTDAGKPVFVSRPANATDDLTSITGITSALISVFADNTLFPSPSPSSGTDKLRCINAGSTRIAFFLRPPLYYVCVSKWKEPESVARLHLEYLHLQILSVITASQLRRIFERRTNFDLRRLLEGAESFLHTLLSRLQSSIAFCSTLSALSSLRVDPSVRTRAGEALLPSSKNGGLDILYTLLISEDSVITLVRPKKHSVHPTDLHILLNALHTPSIAANPASWLPICLPKFNPQGFVHAYVSSLEQEEPPPVNATSDSVIGSEDSPRASPSFAAVGSSGPSSELSPPSIVIDAEDASRGGVSSSSPGGEPHVITSEIRTEQQSDTQSQGGDGNQQDARKPETSTSRNGLSLVIVSGGGEFDAVRRWSESVTKKLETTGLLSLLQTAVKAAPYGCSELGIPGLRHFLYKSRVHVQVTCPTWDEEYQTLENQRRLITLYQTLHDAIHAKSGQETELKLQYIRTDKEAVMGWITQPFELYITLSPKLPKTAAVGAANAVARWAKREEARLFLRDAPIF